MNNEIDVISQKITSKGYDQNISKVSFKGFVYLERGEVVRSISKLNWKRELYGVKVPDGTFGFQKYQEDKKCQSCDFNPKLNCFDCELAKSCDNCFQRITQIKHYSTKFFKLKRLPPDENEYMLPHYVVEYTQENVDGEELRGVIGDAVNALLK